MSPESRVLSYSVCRVLFLHSQSLILGALGGLNTCSRALAAFLVPVDGEPLVSVCANHTRVKLDRSYYTVASSNGR